MTPKPENTKRAIQKNIYCVMDLSYIKIDVNHGKTELGYINLDFI